MTKNKNGQKIRNLIVGLEAAIVIICLSVSITVWFRPLYYFDIGYLKIPQQSGVPAEICKINYDALIDYNLLFGNETLTFPTMTMSENGRIHFEEVKQIFFIIQMIAVTGTVAVAAFAIRSAVKCRKRQEEACDPEQFRWMLYAIRITETIGGLVLLAVSIDWEGSFALMHKLFFRNDYWLFDPKTDPVIRILPDTFFLHCGILIVCLSVLFCVGLKVLFYRKMRNIHGNHHV